MIFDRAECLNWCFSDLLENVTRGKVAEYIVAKALGLENAPRIEWDTADLICFGKMIEVKSSAYVQAWVQKKPSSISFDIAKRTQRWNSNTKQWFRPEKPQRYADVYVFALLSEIDRSIVDPLNTSHWEFLVLSRDSIDFNFRDQKSVKISRLERVAHHVPYENLKSEVLRCVGD
jgi:hypothetical protein